MRRGRVHVSAGARAEGVDPASVRFDGDLALFPGVRARVSALSAANFITRGACPCRGFARRLAPFSAFVPTLFVRQWVWLTRKAREGANLGTKSRPNA